MRNSGCMKINTLGTSWLTNSVNFHVIWTKDTGTYFAKPGLGKAVPVGVRVSASLHHALPCALDRVQGVVSASAFDHLKALLCFDSLAPESAHRHACVADVGGLCGESNVCLLKTEWELEHEWLKWMLTACFHVFPATGKPLPYCASQLPKHQAKTITVPLA